MKRRIAVLLAALAVLLGLGAPAQAAVPYSWWCYRTGYTNVHVYTPSAVGYWTGYRGYRCYGGFYSYV